MVLLGDSSCFKLEATLNRELIHKVFLAWRETKRDSGHSLHLQTLAQKLPVEASRKERPEAVTAEAEGPNAPLP